jgi:uncharacterized protein
MGDGGGVTRAEAVVRKAFDAWAARAGTVFDVLADDVSWTITGTGRLAGTDASRQELIDPGHRADRALPGPAHPPDRPVVVATGDRVSVLWDGHAVALDGRPYDNTHSWFLRVGGDDRVHEVVAFSDGADLEGLFDRNHPAA